LKAGTYLVMFRVPACAVGKHQAYLRADLGGTVTAALWGSSVSATGTGVQTDSILAGILTVAADDDTLFSVQHWCENAVATSGLGLPASSDNSDSYANHREVYTSGFIIKL
jgi:hypothetical protein